MLRNFSQAYVKQLEYYNKIVIKTSRDKLVTNKTRQQGSCHQLLTYFQQMPQNKWQEKHTNCATEAQKAVDVVANFVSRQTLIRVFWCI